MHAYTPKATVVYEQRIAKSFCKALVERATAWPVDGIYSLTVHAYFPVPKSWSAGKRKKAHAGLLRPTIVPDGDNILKAVCDALNGLAWRDDKQVATCLIAKEYVSGDEAEAGLEVQITKLFIAENEGQG